MREYTEEEMEDFRKNVLPEIEEIEREWKENEEARAKRDLERQERKIEELRKRKIKQRKMKVMVHNARAVALWLTIGLSAVGVAVKKPWQNEKENFVDKMIYEADVHGGMIAPDGKKLYGLEGHLESGECLIKGDGPIKERFRCTCEMHDIPDDITDAIIVRFDESYHNHYANAQKIKPDKMFKKYEKEQKKLEKEEAAYGK